MTSRPDDLLPEPHDGPLDDGRDEPHDGPLDDGRDEPLDAALLADLRRAWSELPVPEASPELDDADPLTRAAVAWMRDAYAAQQPARLGPSLPARQRWRQGWRRWRRQAVAAALLAGLGLAVSQWPAGAWRPSGDDHRAAHDHLAAHDTSGAADAGLAEGLADDATPRPDQLAGGATLPATADRAAPDVPRVKAPPPRDPGEPRLVAVADDHISFRAGAVRLVLITDPVSAD